MATERLKLLARGVWGARRFLLRRLLTSLLSVVGATLLVFLLLHMIPGDPVDNLLGEDARPADKAELRRCMDLDQPLPVQLGRFLRSIGDGTLGVSCPDRKTTVAGRIAAVLPYTVTLAVVSMSLALLLALPLGIAAALRPRTMLDATATGVALLGISMPAMWLGPLLLMTFFTGLEWLPGPGEEIDSPRGLILPAVVLSTHLMAMLARMTRSSLLETLNEDYVRTAYAKGLSPTRVVLKHALRNALIPVVTLIGLQAGYLLGGAVVTETIFSWPGVGRLAVGAILARDLPLAQGSILILAVSFIVINLFVDVLYGILDPRVGKR